MKKIFSIVFLVMIFMTLSIFAQNVQVLKVKVQTANVRSEPDSNSSVIKILSRGTLIESTGKVGDWYEITIKDEDENDVSAYINATVVDVVSGQQKVEPVIEPAREEPERAPAAQPRTERVVTEYIYSGGGIKLLGGFASSNISLNRDPLKDSGTGYTMSKFQKSRTGLLGGVGFEMGSRIGFETDILYIQKGVKFAGTFDLQQSYGYKGTFDSTISLDEISAPVLLKFKILPGSTPYVFGGGEIAYVISSKNTYNSTINGKKYNGEEKLTDDEEMNKIDYGIIFGAGYELDLGSMILTVEGRYHMGLANLFKQTQDTENTAGTTTNDWIRSKALVLLLGIKF